MGKKDTRAKNFLSRAEIFAEACNLLFRLNRSNLTVQAESLKEMDSCVNTVIPVPKEKNIERRNDLVRWGIVCDGDITMTAVLALEIQSFVRYCQPVKNALYVGVRWNQELSEIALRNKEQRKTLPKEQRPLLIQQMKKGDNLHIVFQLVIYLGQEPWDAVERASDLFVNCTKDAKRFMPDCPTNVLSLVDLPEWRIRSLNTELRAIAICVRYANNAEKLKKYLKSDPIFQNLSQEANSLIKELIHINLTKKENTEDTSMVCKAVHDMIENGKLEERRKAQKELKKKEQKLHEKDQKLHEKDQKLHEKDQKLHEKDQKLHEKDQKLHEKDQIIKEVIKSHKKEIRDVNLNHEREIREISKAKDIELETREQQMNELTSNVIFKMLTTNLSLTNIADAVNMSLSAVKKKIEQLTAM